MSRDLDPIDLLAIDRLYTDEERGWRDRVRAFVDEHVTPSIEDWFERGEFPRELATGFGDLGVLGMYLDGGSGAGSNAVSYGLANMEIEAGDSGLRSFVSVQGSLVMHPIHAFGTDEQRDEWLPRLASGEAIGCFALTEPDAGSDPSAMTTFARREPGGDWVLNGHKKWNTNGLVSDVAIVWAKTDEGVRGFVVPTDVEGVRFSPLDRAWSLRAAARSELFLDAVRLPADAAMPGAIGLKSALLCLNEARFGIAWGAMGAARTCFEVARDYTVGREQFGKPLASFQLVQERLVEMSLELSKGILLALHVGRLKDEGGCRPEHISMAKMNNAREALRIAREARALLGANGITFDYPVIRHMNNLESVVTYEGTEQIHTLILGSAITGIRAFS